jgi:hypothetical protein
MNQHQHHIGHRCDHAVEYCMPCNVVYCLNCNVTFYEAIATWAGTGTYPWETGSGTASDTFGGSEITVSMHDH